MSSKVLSRLEAKLGEEGMKKVADYLELQASLPDVVRASPYSWIAFAATDKESQVSYITAIDESDLAKEDKEKLKANLQDVWNRYPDKFVVADNLVLSDVDKIMEKRFIASANLSGLGIKWVGDPCHQDFAYYACDGSAYSNYASDAADDPDNSGFELPGYRYYNHYWDANWGVGGAPGKCDGYAGTAQIWVANGRMADAHHDFGLASHYLSDTGNPFHSAGALDQFKNFIDNLFNSNNHALYENYISAQWNTRYNFGNYVSTNTQAITVTDPEQAVKDNAAFSAQYYDYIWNKVNNNPQTFGSDTYVGYYTAQCVRQTAKYNHGLYGYIM